MSADETWLETETEVQQATGVAASMVLESVAETLFEAPPEKRYDVQVEVTER